MFMQLYKPNAAGKNEERIGNSFETSATFALFQRKLFSVGRLLIGLIPKLPRKDEESFWQWYPGYGFKVCDEDAPHTPKQIK
eukprot:5804135-Amphidinium_carterae.1